MSPLLFREGLMKERNRFSSLLKHLMSMAKLKNYTLAKELQYDESYISKWINGNLMPTEKTHEKVLRDISRCIVGALDDESREAMLAEYQITRFSDLEMAIYDNLEAEYSYCMELKETTGSEIAQKTAYFPELTLAQFLAKMHHPSLRQVKALDVIAAMDILSLDRHYQLALAQLESSNNVASRNYPNVRFSMLVNLDAADKHNTYNVTFLLNLLTNLSDIDFQLYSWPRAAGKIVFAVRDAYSIAGMVIDENHCMAVTTSEDTKNCNGTYDRLRSLCSQEMLVVRKSNMREMLDSRNYIQSLFARNQRWMLGRMTEHFLPDDLFETLAQSYCARNRDTTVEELRKIHALTRSVLQQMNVRMLITENAMTDFAVTGELDFFNTKMHLTPQERLTYLTHACSLQERNPGLEVRLLRNGAVSDIQYIPDPTLLLSDTVCYLRLTRTGPVNNISIVNKVPVCDMFRHFFDDVWANEKYDTIDDPAVIADTVSYAIQMVKVQMLSQ